MLYIPVTHYKHYDNCVDFPVFTTSVSGDESVGFNATVGKVSISLNRALSQLKRARDIGEIINVFSSTEFDKKSGDVYLTFSDSLPKRKKSKLSLNDFLQNFGDENAYLFLVCDSQEEQERVHSLIELSGATCFTALKENEKFLLGLSALFKRWEGCRDRFGKLLSLQDICHSLMKLSNLCSIDVRSIITASVNSSMEVGKPDKKTLSPIDWTKLNSNDVGQREDEIDRLITPSSEEGIGNVPLLHLLQLPEDYLDNAGNWVFETSFVKESIGGVVSKLNDYNFTVPSNKFLTAFREEFLNVAAGIFYMGVDAPNGEVYDRPRHILNLDFFQIQKSPLSRDLYSVILSKSAEEDDKNLPATRLSFYDGREIAEFLTNEFRRCSLITSEYRVAIPSEAQWEKSARGPNSLIYPWGNEFSDSLCNYRGDKTNLVRDASQIKPIDFYSPQSDSYYGCQSMIGNAWEWTRSLWGASYREADYAYPYEDIIQRENEYASSNIRRVIRGGAFYYDRYCLQSFIRNNRRPDDKPVGSSVRFVIEKALVH